MKILVLLTGVCGTAAVYEQSFLLGGVAVILQLVDFSIWWNNQQ